MVKAESPPVVKSTLNYFLKPKDGELSVVVSGTAGYVRRKFDERPVEITDLRNSAAEYSLNQHGFQIGSFQTKETAFDDENRIMQKYYPDVINFVKRRTGATRVVPFSCLVRKERWETAQEKAKNMKDEEKLPAMTPARFVHIDSSYTGSERMIHERLPDEAETLKRTRWGIINVWRPIEQTVNRDALAVCDARTVRESDLCPVEIKLLTYQQSDKDGKTDSKNTSNELWNVLKNPEHKWYYFSNMTPEEALMIKIYDSKLDGTARRTPHSAFSRENDFGPPRKSIETRCLVFWEDQDPE